MAASLALGIRFAAASAGSGSFVDSGAVTGYRAASGNLTNGKTYRYRAESATLSEWEWGTGVWNSGTSTLTRTVSFSSSGSTVVFTAAPQVAITIEPADILSFADVQTFSSAEQARAQLNLGIREVLTAARTYYVRADGSDANNGLTNSAGGAKLTIQAAVNAALTLDANNNTVTINVISGTFTAGVILTRSIFGASSFSIIGDTTTPTNVLLNLTNTNGFVIDGAAVTIGGFKVQVATAGSAFIIRNGARVTWSGAMNIGAIAGDQIVVDGSSLAGIAALTISGGSSTGAHVHVINWGNYGIDGQTVTITGSPTFATYFYGIASGIVTATGTTYSGACTASFGSVVHGEGYLKASNTIPGGPVSAVGGNYNDTYGPITTTGTSSFVAINATGGNPSLFFQQGGVTQSSLLDSGSSLVVGSDGSGSVGVYLPHGGNSWGSFSDARLPYKKTATELTELPDIQDFHLYQNMVNGRMELFVKAQEFVRIAPALVHVGSDDPDFEPTQIQDDASWKVFYDRSGMVAMAYAKQQDIMIKKQFEMIEELKARVSALGG
jgi:hypothetical protein